MVSVSQLLRGNAVKLGLLAVLFVPMLASVRGGAGNNDEHRHLAPAPSLPTSWEDFLQLPTRTDAWINDHFGMRGALVKANNQVRFKAFREFPTIQMAAGRHGRVFLAAHGTTAPPFSAITNVCGGRPSPAPGTAEYFTSMMADFERMGMHPAVLIVPSAAVLHSSDTPKWLEPRCAATDTAVDTVLRDPALSPMARERIFYPLQQMRAMAGDDAIYPKTWFHWSGPGLGEVARLTVARFWGRAPAHQQPWPVKSTWMNSDVNHLFPGVHLASYVAEPDFATANVQACFGSACFPEFAGFPNYARVMDDVSRFTNPAAPDRRLLIMSDSFGSKSSGWFSRYYRTVEQMATHSINDLSQPDMETLKQVLLRDPQKTDILFLYHDGSAVYNMLRQGVQRLHEPPRPGA
ncbi:hypothetical protein GJV26_18615 [Massilia dura]|uniref:AlgX/AlgJ SGNH hydrolase-like domain-containing protein n=1 Tax=Pseudoduganella dura TaxID=321982 RepID=A0A6I3XRQ1_9BURK|nr:hypothetical protein [Pseudoduganella dura]MUI14455.1 hypothetical protein [Pseudoduganella dura]GGY07984.1 hypothetical protein GCM10007386_43070 [Pseudoduganella dura]